jgi:hypothetical protein
VTAAEAAGGGFLAFLAVLAFFVLLGGIVRLEELIYSLADVVETGIAEAEPIIVVNVSGEVVSEEQLIETIRRGLQRRRQRE